MDSLRRLPVLSALDEYGVLDYAALLVVAFLVLALARYVRQSLKPEGALRKLIEKVSRSVQNPAQQAVRYEKRGELELAAGLYKDLGRPDDAVRCYRQLDDPILAGEYLEAMECFAEAEAFYEKANSRTHLRNLWKVMGKWDHLAMSLLSEGKTNMAAEAFEEARMPLRAAEIYEKVENFQKAGELYKAGQDPARAAVAFEKAYSNQRMFMKDKPEMAIESARLYREAGAAADAGRLFALAGEYGQAGAAYEEAGQHKEAGEYFYRAREYGRAVANFDRGGDRVRSALVRAEELEGERQLGEAARCYRTGNNLIKAAELFDASGSPSEAAECYAATGAYGEAAECHARAGEKGAAADMFQRAGNYQRAAELFLEAGEMEKAISNFEQGGRNYDAGLLLSQMGRSAPAIAALRRLQADDERYREANYLLGNLLRKNDLLSEAVEAYQKAAAGHPVVTNTLDLYYNLADALQAIGRTAEAEIIFREIEAVKPDFRDVKQRAVGNT